MIEGVLCRHTEPRRTKRGRCGWSTEYEEEEKNVTGYLWEGSKKCNTNSLGGLCLMGISEETRQVRVAGGAFGFVEERKGKEGIAGWVWQMCERSAQIVWLAGVGVQRLQAGQGSSPAALPCAFSEIGDADAWMVDSDSHDSRRAAVDGISTSHTHIHTLRRPSAAVARNCAER